MDFTKIPKVELHCHLDGSLDIDTSLEILREQGKDFTKEQLVKEMTVPEGCTSLAEYLQKFSLPISILQTEEELKKGAYGLGKNAAAENVKYIEVRFAPQFHTTKGLSYQRILESVKAGLMQAKEEFGLESGIIVCGMRGTDMETNLAMLKASREFLGDGVVSCDLAGNEAAFPPNEFAEFFAEAKKLQMPYTIHGGECGSAINVKDSIELGASRIGHGIAAAKDEGILNFVKDKHIGLEVCPTSNIQTKAVENWEQYPIPLFMDRGILFNINTDNRSVSGINLSSEYKLLADKFGFTEGDFKLLYENAIEMAFCNDDIKNKLVKEGF